MCVTGWVAPLDPSAPWHSSANSLVSPPQILARRARVTPQSAAKALNRLEQLGLVSRDPHPVHGRIQQVYLTEEGATTLAATTGVTLALESQLCGALNDVARRQLLANLTALREWASVMVTINIDRIELTPKVSSHL